jgi:hypothetical protein
MTMVSVAQAVRTLAPREPAGAEGGGAVTARRTPERRGVRQPRRRTAVPV